jgi:uncharacterized protein
MSHVSAFQAGLVGVGLSLMVSCSPQTIEPSNAGQPMPTMRQSLPIEATAKIAGKTILLEVARTPQQQAIGLMNRTNLASDRGMLFVFESPRPASFWMKNTLIPLDMIFLRNGVVKAIAKNAQPCKADPCPTYTSQTEITDQVLELRGGQTKELGLKVGDRIPVVFIKPKR